MKCSAEFWLKGLITGYVSALLLYVEETAATGSLQIILTMWYNIAFTAILVATFVILYQTATFRNMTDGLRTYGISLTNYVAEAKK